MDLNYFFLATSIVALAEIGDKTQLLSLMLSARYKDHIGPSLGESSLPPSLTMLWRPSWEVLFLHGSAQKS